MKSQFLQQLKATKKAAATLPSLSSTQKNAVLKDLAVQLHRQSHTILSANKRDFARLAKDYALSDRLLLTPSRIAGMRESIEAVVALDDPIGNTLERRTLKNGLGLTRVATPLGVLGIIYEARPNVTTEIFSLAFKAGNAVVLKGGSDAYETNKAIVGVIHTVLKKHRLPTEVALLIDPGDRNLVRALMRANGLIDVLIPRGSNRLINAVRTEATVPVIETGAGVCHMYVEKNAALDWAGRAIVSAKTRRPSVCNALDTLLVDAQIAKEILVSVAPELARHKVMIHADKKSFALLRKMYPAQLLVGAKESDFGREFLSLEMAVKVVADWHEALAHIVSFTSGHSEAIFTSDQKIADAFVNTVDAAAVYVNAPTNFTDGFEFGLGAEVGISTQKLHARGPMGLDALTTYKWVIHGAGQIRPQ